MYKRKTEEDLDCGLYVTMKVLGGKWKPCIIDSIARGAHRPSEIHKLITATTPRVLDMQLRDLLNYGIVSRKHKGTYPLYAEYHLTAFGRGLLPMLKQMAAWGEENKEFVRQRTMEIQEASESETCEENSGANHAQWNSICETI